MISVIKYFKNLEIVVGVINSKKMPSNSEKVDMLLILGESHGNYEAAIRLYARRYPNRRTPSNHVLRNLEITLREHGKFKKERVRRRTVTTMENEVAVIESVTNNPHFSQRQIARQLNISKGSIF
jgi:hypothetical protein